MKKYLKILTTSVSQNLAYRNEVLGRVLVSLFVFVGFFAFWSAAFMGRGEIAGFDLEGMVGYYLVISVLSGLIASDLGFRISDDVVSGRITLTLLKPVDEKWQLVFAELGKLTVDIAIKVAIFGIAALVIFRGDALSFIELSNLPVFGLSLLLAYLLNINITWMMGITAFWFDQVDQLLYGLRRVFVFLAGGVIPLALFPGVLQDIVYLLPFRFILDVPVSLLLGTAVPGGQLELIAWQFFWVVATFFLGKLMFKFAIRQNESVGI